MWRKEFFFFSFSFRWRNSLKKTIGDKKKIKIYMDIGRGQVSTGLRSGTGTETFNAAAVIAVRVTSNRISDEKNVN